MHSRTRFTSKLLLPFISALALLIAACGSGGGSGTGAPQAAHTKAAANKQVLVTTIASGAVSDFDTLDPALVVDFNSGYAVSTVFTGLVGLNDHSQVYGQEAQSWDKSADGLTYTFHLRPNLKFSDGTPLTAQDVAYSIDRALNPATKSPSGAYYLRYIKDSDKRNSGVIKSLIGDSLIVQDPNTLEIVLNKPVAFFLDTLTYPNADTVEKSLIDKYGTKWTDHLTEGGGDGPFKVKKYQHDVTFNVVPNPDFYGPKRSICPSTSRRTRPTRTTR
jgi:oligopeptide transport system substrate-binding protein